MRCLARRLIICASVAALIGSWSAKAADAATLPATLRSPVTSLDKAAASLPHHTRRQARVRSTLLRSVHGIKTRLGRGQGCAARRSLRKLRKAIGRAQLKPAASAPLSAFALRLESTLLTSSLTRRCGGSKSVTSTPRTRVLLSSPTELKMTLALPAMQFVAKSAGGKAWEQLKMVGLSLVAPSGSPAIPALGRSFALPKGAKAAMSVTGTSSYTLDGVDAYPGQPSAVDGVTPVPPRFLDKPFTLDHGAYSSSTPVPATPANTNAVGTLRDLAIDQLNLAGAQYTPRTKQLKVFTSINVDIKFKGGTQTFGGPETASPYNASWLKLYGGVLSNGQTVLAHLTAFDHLKLPCGEQLLIVTSHALRGAADTLAAGRNAAGILSRVVETGAGSDLAGTTPGAIRTYVQNEIGKVGCVSPSYLVLLGDVNHVPTFAGDATNPGIPSDFDYGLKFRDFYLPDVAVGRLPAATLDQANTIVAKILGYESSPPPALSFYKDATITSFFQGAGTQDERGFARTSEAVRNGLLDQGKTVDRVYATAAKNPLTDDLGNALPSDIQKPRFGWSGNSSDLVGDVNAGRFLIVSRDHGSRTAIGNPYWDTSSVASMTNGGKLPVFWLIACETGWFDDPALPSLAETLLRQSGGGGAAAIAASRDSPTEINNRFTLGLTDAVWPSFLPYAGSSTPIRRIGDILNSAKLYVTLDAANANGFYSAHFGATSEATGDIRAEQRLYNLFGDPSMEMWVSRPAAAGMLSGVIAGSIIHVNSSLASAGGVATLLENGMPVGKAFVGGNGRADIAPDHPLGSGVLELLVDKDGMLPTKTLVRNALTPPPATTTTTTTTASTTSTTSTTTPPSQPDLAVTSVSSGASPGSANGYISITINNIGAGTAGPFSATVSGTDNNCAPQTVTLQFPNGLAPGGQQTATRSGLLYNTLTGVANPDHAVSEADSFNDTNNVATGQGPTKNCPDLAVKSVSSGVSRSFANGYISITINNIGAGTAGPFSATVSGTDSNCAAQTVTVQFPNGLAPGGQQTVTVSGLLYNTLTGVANPDHAVSEADSFNDTNNVATGQGPPLACKP